MRSLVYPAILLCCLGRPAIAQVGSREKLVLSLDRGWEFRQRGAPRGASAAVWLPAKVPGDVHLDLLSHRLIPDPLYRDNEARLQWIAEADWEYRAAVVATPGLLRYRNIELVFEGLDAEPSDNSFDLLPGEPVDIRVRGAASMGDVRSNLAVRSHADAFVPGSRGATGPSSDRP